MRVEGIETELVAIADKLRSITVEIANHRSGGSGVIWSADGLVITNAHVVKGLKTRVKLSNGKYIAGKVIASDTQQDLAAIQLNIERNSSLSTPTIGNSLLLRPGEIVLAMGSPYGFSGTLTMGVVHAPIEGELSKTKLNWAKTSIVAYPSGAIATDIRLAPGNSGGVLANALGEVVGINTAIISRLAMAIPAHQVEHFVNTIKR
ncbi:MAG: trypsin-like peptidase domain-containing protein [Cyanobacteria bacterium P01_A01_bin.40]